MIIAWCLLVSSCSLDEISGQKEQKPRANSYLLEKSFHEYSPSVDEEMFISLLEMTYYEDLIESYFNRNFESWFIFYYPNPVHECWTDDLDKNYYYCLQYTYGTTEWSSFDLDIMERVYKEEKWISNIKMYVRKKYLKLTMIKFSPDIHFIRFLIEEYYKMSNTK